MDRGGGWVAYAGPFEFPWGQATSRRVYGIVRSLAAGGRDVVVATGQREPGRLTRLEEADGSGSVSYLGLGEVPPVGAGLLARQAQWFLRSGAATARWLDAQPGPPSHVVVYGGDAPYAAHLQRWCRRNNVPFLADVTDWYSPRQLRGGPFGPAYISAQLALRYFYPKCDGIITMSSFFEERYGRRGCPVLRVPPTLDVRSLPARTGPADGGGSDLTLVYAGRPGKKDLIADMIRAVGLADPTGTRMEFRVLGPTPEEILALLGGDPVPRNVRLLGRLPQQEMPRHLQEADFSLLLRATNRTVQAGFSTKFSESLANGTPVIANLNSDLVPYLRDGREGLVCRDHTVGALVETLQVALRLSVPERVRMREAARSRALESFDYRVYTKPLGALFDAVTR